MNRRLANWCGLAPLVAAVTAVLAPVAIAAGPAYPTGPVQLVVPFPPGGAVDITGRIVAKKLGDVLGQQVVIDNRAGAGTVIGATYVSKAAADGYTLLISSGSTFTVNPALKQKLPYDPVQSFDPVAMVAGVPLLLIANRDVPINDLKQLEAAVRQSPDKYNYGSFGNGTTGHFAGELLWNAMGIKVTHVAYKGSAPAMQDLLGGQIPLAIDTVASALPQLQAGKVKAIAVTGDKRAAQLPKVPTVAEGGHPGFSADSWLAVFAPRGVPADVRLKLQSALATVVNDPDVQASLAANGLQPSYAPGAAVAARIDVELPRMRAIASRAQIKGD